MIKLTRKNQLKIKHFLYLCKECLLDWFCLTLLLIPGVSGWVDRQDKKQAK
jgi:hypothetical protein